MRMRSDVRDSFEAPKPGRFPAAIYCSCSQPPQKLIRRPHTRPYALPASIVQFFPLQTSFSHGGRLETLSPKIFMIEVSTRIKTNRSITCSKSLATSAAVQLRSLRISNWIVNFRKEFWKLWLIFHVARGCGEFSRIRWTKLLQCFVLSCIVKKSRKECRISFGWYSGRENTYLPSDRANRTPETPLVERSIDIRLMSVCPKQLYRLQNLTEFE